MIRPTLSLTFLSTVLFFLLQNTARAFTSPTTSHFQRYDTRCAFDLISMVQHFGQKAKLSHILIGPATSKTGRGMDKEAATEKLLELKEMIDNDPEKFANAATEFSSCFASTKKGGDLGEFGPGLLVGPIDKIAFQEKVGIVHGPVSSPYGEHLVFLHERTGGS